jgi:hypothetical protein
LPFALPCSLYLPGVVQGFWLLPALFRNGLRVDALNAFCDYFRFGRVQVLRSFFKSLVLGLR